MSVGRLMMVDGWLMVDELKCFTSRARSPSAQEDELSGFEDSARSVYMPPANAEEHAAGGARA